VTLDALIAEITRLGYSLHLHGPMFDRRPRYCWEATVSRSLGQRRSAVGHYSAIDPTSALIRALDLCAHEFEVQEHPLQQPTCAPIDFDSALANLLTPSATMTLSPPMFKLKEA